jgi:hypothetical protein
MTAASCDRCGHDGVHAPGPVLDDEHASVEGGSVVYRRLAGEGACASQCPACRDATKPQKP